MAWNQIFVIHRNQYSREPKTNGLMAFNLWCIIR